MGRHVENRTSSLRPPPEAGVEDFHMLNMISASLGGEVKGLEHLGPRFEYVRCRDPPCDYMGSYSSDVSAANRGFDSNTCDEV